ncbi:MULTISPECIES: substrate-binding periplasmic protein [Bradyrhizobium]|uniref:Bll7637 protein n=2 Tax=Bradyrhizobium diazoefficiens TaxID=1355477 RepID=Q89D08_BRADU|nr:transporter substrate-binding domain-containing protein [Bradyrhizobium diazoefficiens]MBP1061965.1 polar amino acid transport system substrate-binding protein [Bradyrhizobium japonicum]AND92567.1 ABC transporter substrate-binding protein [Bradyrhizobium diazoefficiens USDA 110]AWO94433.1 transporter substrate-binding domain-containing protein [Bradyrhizobium diazoefficiens]MBP1096008.1 polar amino acid transport system substrate-binding protein [Bradyrhizobium japonicum]PDT56964.1 ABC tran
MRKVRGTELILPLIIVTVAGLLGPARARSLETIRSAGVLGLCAHPNSLPFASKAGDPPGFQVELGQALARELGVSLRLDWIITQYQMRSAGCDILLDVIADREAQGETHLRISKPYYRTGVALAVPSASTLTSFKSLNEHTKVGVQVGSVAAMIISQRHVPTSTFGFESDSLEALSNNEIDAAAVTPTVASYFNLTHPDKALRILDRDESTVDLNWNVAVGMVRPDDALREAMDGALDRLRTDGTVDRIYKSYGVVLQAPR